jgi:hypothetical protein
MATTIIHQNMRRCLLSDAGTVTAYLKSAQSYDLENTERTSGAAGAGTTGLTLFGSMTNAKVGGYIYNVTKDAYYQVKSKTGTTEVELYPAMDTVGNKYGLTTSTTAGKLVASAGDFVTRGVAVGDIAALRDLSAFGVVTAVDSATELSVDNDIFPNATAYSIMKGWEVGDVYEICTAVLDGTAGQVMVEIPLYYFNHEFTTDQHSWAISPVPRPGFVAHPAFVRPDGTLRSHIYVAAFEGAISQRGFANDVLTGYNLGTSKLISAAGYRPVTDGQRSEFRTVSRNRGAGWSQLDWMTNWAVQLLMLVEMESMNSQTAIGNGLTNWSTAQRDAWVVNTSNVSVIQTGWSLRSGNSTVNVNPGASIVGGYLSYRGIENQYGQIWKWVDGVNYNDGRVYLSNDPAGFADNIGTGGGYFDTGLDQPTATGYIRSIHDSPYGFIVKSSSGGSASTYIPDNYWYASGWRVARSGGGVITGGDAGFAALAAHHASSLRFPDVGGRVCFRSNA